MEEAVVKQLLSLNQDFYNRFAGPFAQTRAAPQPGFFHLLEYTTFPYRRFLDTGCGEGRLGRFLRVHGEIQSYVGVDFSPALIEKAAGNVKGEFHSRDLSRAGSLDDLGKFDGAACLATLQHIPGRQNRRQLILEIVGHLQPGSRLFMSNWQFLDSPRQRRKIVKWEQVGLLDSQLENNDFLLSWQRNGLGLRYVAYIDQREVRWLADETACNVVDMFRSDGREGNLNLYAILEV